jgi:UDP-N-acetylmuramoyl-L-alanyl-D-glutamate--2,6-diaminopimelate ligase
MEEYFAAKAKLFSFEFTDLAVINIDDAYDTSAS